MFSSIKGTVEWTVKRGNRSGKQSWFISLMAPSIAVQDAGQIAGFIKNRSAGKQERGAGKG